MALCFYKGETKCIGKKIEVDKKNSQSNIGPWEIKEARYVIYKDNVQYKDGVCNILQEEKKIYFHFNCEDVGTYKIVFLVNLNPNISKFTEIIMIKEA